MGPVPFATVGNGKFAAPFTVPQAQEMTILLTWKAPAPARLQLHAQSPDGTLHAATMAPGSLDPTLRLALEDPAAGEWILGIAAEGPIALVEWTATIAFVP